MEMAYTCDPGKNTECKKRHCWWNGGECRITSRKEYAVDAEQKKPKPWCCHKVCPHIGGGMDCDECRREYMEGRR